MAWVRGYLEDEVDLLVADFVLVIDRAIGDALAKTAAGLPVPVIASTAGGFTAASSAGVGPGDVAAFTTHWTEQVDGVLTPYVAELYVGSAASVAIGIGDAFPDDVLPGIPLVPDEYAVTYLSTVSNRLVGVGDEIWEDVRNELLDGVAQGQSIPQLAARIRGVAAFDPTRATRVARTEVHAAAEAGSLAQVKYAGYETDQVTKEWVSTHDIRTRLTHSLADGQRVGLDEPFDIGGHFLLFPGDPSGPADEIINCRCTALYDIQDSPTYRCGGALVADAPPDATVCVVPLGPASIDHLTSAVKQEIHAAFMGVQKISPAWGGAKIFKLLQEARQKLKKISTVYEEEFLDDRQLLAAVDAIYGKKGKKTFLQVFDEWSQTPNGKKAIGLPKMPTPTHATSPITVPPKPIITLSLLEPPEPRTLPSVEPKPDVKNLKFVEQAGGAQGAIILEDVATGNKWIFKTIKYGPDKYPTYSSQFTGTLDTAIARIQSKAMQTRPGVYAFTWEGKKGSIQFIFHAEDAFPDGFDPLKLPAVDIAEMQREQIFDWLISNHDTHTEQWIRLQSGRLYGIDKGQAFKFIGQDKLDWNYSPVHYLPGTQATHQAMWKAFIDGKDIDLQDPTTGSLGQWIDDLMAIDDKTYRDLLTPFALAREKAGYGSASKMLDLAVARKNSLKKDFAEFWARAQAERVKHTKVTPPKPTVPPPAATPPKLITPPSATTHVGTGDAGDISGLFLGEAADVHDQWLVLGAGKKVTPAWGGAKIYKLVQELKAWAKIHDPDVAKLTDLQLLRILDSEFGFKGKPKTYESVVMDWIDTPGSTSTILKYGLLDDSLKKVPTPPPVVTPIISPAAKLVLNEPTEAFDHGHTLTEFELFKEVTGKKKNTILAYAQSPETGDILRAVSDVTDDGKPLIVIERFVDGTWKHDEMFSTPSGLLDFYDFDTDVPWYAVAPKASATLKPTIVPGKMPGDVATADELWDSRYLWKDSDVIATGADIDPTGAAVQFRLVAGRGVIRFERRVVGKTDWIVEGKFFTSQPGAPEVFHNFQWKLSGDVLVDKGKKSPIPDKTAGSQVTTNDIWYGTSDSKPGDVVAYAQVYQQDGGLLRIKYGSDGVMRIEVRHAGSKSWVHYGNAPKKSDLDYLGGKLTWYVAKADGSIPDELLADIPGKGLPGGKTHTKMGGAFEGEEIDEVDIVTYADSFSEYEIIATGLHTVTGEEYRIYLIGFTYVRERKVNDAWVFDGIVKKLTNPADVTTKSEVKWFASADVVKPTSYSATVAKHTVDAHVKAATPKKSPVKKVAAKKTPATPPAPKKLVGDETHFPGVKNGEPVTSESIVEHYSKYEDGTIIAQTSSTWGQTRVVVVDGKLVLQEKTAAGAWKSKKIVTVSWQLFGKWTATNEKLGKPQHNAVKKFIEKKITPPTPVAPASTPTGTGSTKAPSPIPVTPFEMRDVDITPWNDVEQEEMFQHFRSKGVYTSSSPEQVWSALQATKQFFQAKYGDKYTKLNEVELLRIIDQRSAALHGKTNTHPFEAKIVQWLKTPQGKFHVNRRIDAPILAREIPAPQIDFDASDVLPDAQSYKVIGVSEAKKFSDESHARYGAWTDQQKASLRSYTGGVYSAWNQAIRRGELASYKAAIIRAQQGMRPSTRPMLLHRGTSFAELNDPSISSYETLLAYQGRTYTSRGFNSTSVGGNPAFGGQLLIEYECPVGTPMAWVQQISQHPGEREMLLPTHLVYKIISVKKNGGTTVMRVRVIGVGQ